MKLRAIFSLLSLSMLLLVPAFLGCETSPADDVTLKISPSGFNFMTAGSRVSSVELTASGGWDYEWELENSKLGSLNRTKGATVVYTPHTRTYPAQSNLVHYTTSSNNLDRTVSPEEYQKMNSTTQKFYTAVYSKSKNSQSGNVQKIWVSALIGTNKTGKACATILQ